MAGSFERDTLAPDIRHLDRSAPGAEWRDLRSAKSRLTVEGRSLRYAAPQARSGETFAQPKADKLWRDDGPFFGVVSSRVDRGKRFEGVFDQADVVDHGGVGAGGVAGDDGADDGVVFLVGA